MNSYPSEIIDDVLIDENRKLFDALMGKFRPPLPEAYLKLPQVRRQKPCSA